MKVAALDLGGTNIRAALCEEDGRIIRRTSCGTGAEEGKDAVLGRIIDSLEKVIGGERADVRAIGIGAPGPLDPWEGVIFEAPNLPGWHNVPLKKIVADHFGIPTFVGNDANVAALAEHRFGAGRGFSHIIYITVSTGIGGGIIIEDRLLLGARGLAGEVGHITVEANGPRCNCGNIGCLEALASGPAIAREAARRIREGERSLITELIEGDLDELEAEVVTRAAQQGDRLAREVLRRAGFYLGIGIVSYMHLFNPSRIIIGGGVANAGPLLFDPINEVISQRAMSHFREGFAVVPAALGGDVGLLGAMLLALDGLRNL